MTYQSVKRSTMNMDSLRSWGDVWTGKWRRSCHIAPRAKSTRNSWAASLQVKFLPATFRMVFACLPLLLLLINQLNKPIREWSVTWNLRFIYAQNSVNACDSLEIHPWFTWRSPITRRNVLHSHLYTSCASNFRRTEYFRNTGNWWDPHGGSKPRSCLPELSRTIQRA